MNFLMHFMIAVDIHREIRSEIIGYPVSVSVSI